ncbi:17S U2 SnRNP complex component HTATSF1-like [Rhopilema esculentum]|uniref:17S U2 SnRNP complex component HTATSF1-like n=1 Tax=Rhopilema esculentum TaxID=499914 RepID=UPI0031DFF321
MSEVESEHDTDSSDEEVAEEQLGKRESVVDGSTVDISSTTTDLVNELNTKPITASSLDQTSQAKRSGAEVSDLTEDFLAELKQAGHQAVSSQYQQNKMEPWQLYLHQQKTAVSQTYQDPTDGTVYEFDAEKRAWFPKVDEDFIAAYQANYGFTETGEPLPPEELAKKQEEANDSADKTISENKVAGQKRKAMEPAWFEIDPDKNPNVYVSGLPVDITEQEFSELMGKCGIIMEDQDTSNLKIKLYKDKQGKNKGDGRCCYLRAESVPLALQLLDESEFKGHTIHVEQAVFQQKGKFDPSLKPKKKKKKKKKQAGQEKLLDWVDRDSKRSKFDRIVILKHMFNDKEFEKEPQLIIDLREEISSECEKFGTVKKVLIFDRHPDGVCSVLFQEPEMADACIEALNDRWFGGHKITAETYDGATDYQVKETDEERDKRIKEWEDFLAHESFGNEIQATKAQELKTAAEQAQTTDLGMV